MRMTEFEVALHREFGEMVGDTLLNDTVLSELDGKTPQEALDSGYEIRDVWLALCRHQQVPEERQWGPDIGAGDMVE